MGPVDLVLHRYPCQPWVQVVLLFLVSQGDQGGPVSLGSLVALESPDLLLVRRTLPVQPLLWVPLLQPVPGILGCLVDPILPSFLQPLGSPARLSGQEVQGVP